MKKAKDQILFINNYLYINMILIAMDLINQQDRFPKRILILSIMIKFISKPYFQSTIMQIIILIKAIVKMS